MGRLTLIAWAATLSALLILASQAVSCDSDWLPGIELSSGANEFSVCDGPRKVPPHAAGEREHSHGCQIASHKTGETGSVRVRKLGEKQDGNQGGLRLSLSHRDSHPSQISMSPKDSLQQSLKRDTARTHGFRRRVKSRALGYASAAAAVVSSSTSKARGPSSPEAVHAPLEFEGTLESGASLGSGEYFMDIYLGTPPRHIPVIIDTGSDLTWVQCNPCEYCYSQQGPIFEPQGSHSYEQVTCHSPDCLVVNPYVNSSTCSVDQPRGCQYYYWYGDLSNTTGDFAFETFTLNVSKGETIQIEKVMFGCGHNNEGLFYGAGGLLGMGQGGISFASQVGSLYGNKFSYCLVDRDDPLNVSSTLVFGEENVLSTMPTNVQYTPFTKNPRLDTFYYVNISQLVVGGENLTIPESAWSINSEGGGGTIVDSGTTLTYFTEPAYLPVRAAFESKVSLPRADPMQPLDLCYDISQNPDPSLPTFSIVFVNGAVWQLPRKNVFIQPDPDEEILCLAILGSPASSMSIIGNFQQQNFHIIYDRAKSQLGFEPMQCSSL